MRKRSGKRYGFLPTITFLSSLFFLVAGLFLGNSIAKDAGLNQVTSIKAKSTKDSTEITIKSKGESNYTDYRLEDPSRVMIDISKANVKDVKNSVSDDGFVKEVKVTQLGEENDNLGRIEIVLAKSLKYQVRKDGNVLKVSIEHQEEAAPTQSAPAGPPAGETPAEVPPLAEPGAGVPPLEEAPSFGENPESLAGAPPALPLEAAPVASEAAPPAVPEPFPEVAALPAVPVPSVEAPPLAPEIPEAAPPAVPEPLPEDAALPAVPVPSVEAPPLAPEVPAAAPPAPVIVPALVPEAAPAAPEVAPAPEEAAAPPAPEVAEAPPAPVIVPAPLPEAAPPMVPEAKPVAPEPVRVAAVPVAPPPRPVAQMSPREEIKKLAWISGNKIELAEPIKFLLNEAVILPESLPVVNYVLKVMQENPGLKVRVEGHTDDEGPARYNQELSEYRSIWIKIFLMARGITADRIQVFGFGKSRPVASNTTPAGREKNRRVELRIIGR